MFYKGQKDYWDEESESLSEILKTAYDSNYVLTCSSAPNKVLKSETGIVANHAYSILNVVEYNGDLILKLRNPWGKFEFKGKYSEENDEIWEDEQLRELVGYEKKDDGTFCMTI